MDKIHSGMNGLDSEGIRLSEINQTERQIPRDSTYMWNLRNKPNRNKLIDTANRVMVARGKRDWWNLVKRLRS